MTRKKAITRLIDERDNDIFASDFRNKQHEAMSLAIKSLEAWDKVNDEIDRKRNSGQWSEAVVYGLDMAIRVIMYHLGEVVA